MHLNGMSILAPVLQVHEWPIGNDTIKSKMEIDPTTQKDSGFYECQANNQYAVDSRGFRTDYVMCRINDCDWIAFFAKN